MSRPPKVKLKGSMVGSSKGALRETADGRTMPRAQTLDYERALAHWSRADPVLARLARTHAPRTLPRPPEAGFASLVTSLLHQQVSVAAGRSIERKLRRACEGRVTAARIRGLSPTALRACGVSRQKQGYLRDLAAKTLDGSIDFRRLSRHRDEDVVSTLTQVKGIGPWTAKMFLLFHLRRPDVVAHEDLGLQVSVQSVYGIPRSRAARFLERKAPVWSPYGSLASLTLWAHKDQ